MAVQIQLRRDTSTNWTTANPTLSLGELGLETDGYRYKIGDGATAWNSLGYAELAGTDVFTINEQTGTAYTLVGGDAGKLIKMTNAAANTLTVPPSSSVNFDIGTTINVVQYGLKILKIQEILQYNKIMIITTIIENHYQKLRII